MIELSQHFSTACSVAIKDRRLSLGLSQDMVAARSKLARSYICDVERGSRNPSLHNLTLIAEALETSTSQIVFDTELQLLKRFDPEAANSGNRLHTELYNYACDRMSRGLIVCDRQGQIVLVNRAAFTAAGHVLESPPKEKWPDVFGLYHADGSLYEPDELPLAKALQGEIVEKQPVFIKNERVPDTREFAVAASPIRDQSGSLLGAMVVLNPAVY